jgi:hypothetical protein
MESFTALKGSCIKPGFFQDVSEVFDPKKIDARTLRQHENLAKVVPAETQLKFCSVCADLEIDNLRDLPGFHKDLFFQAREGSSTFSLIGEGLHRSFLIQVNTKWMREQADSGCQVCFVLVDGISHFWGPGDWDIQIVREEGHPVLVDSLYRGEDSKIHREIEFYTDISKLFKENSMLLSKSCDLDEPGGHKWVSRCSADHVKDPSSEEGFNRIKGWIDQCLRCHGACQVQSSRCLHALPTRVLDLECKAQTDSPSVLETEKIVGTYAALTYRWSAPLQTTRANLDQMKKGIEWTSLPKTFQDAIVITRKLGLRYLWIDSLCIIQDDVSDWEKESSQMASIYKNSLVTISAASASGNDEDLLCQRGQLHKATVQGDSGNPFQVYSRYELGHDWIFWPKQSSDKYHDSEVSAHPILTRGWCFQERLLSTRIIHYTQQEMVYECQCGYQCECTYLDRPSQEYYKQKRFHLKSEIARAKMLNRSPDLTKVLGAWADLVENYAKKDLTFPSDILPALSGMANDFNDFGLGTYYAGIWEKQLPKCLLWSSLHHGDSDPEVHFRCHRHPPPRKVDKYLPRSLQHTVFLAPSFLWTSRIGPISMPRAIQQDGEEQLFKLLEISCTPKGQDPLGQVSSGFLRMSGLLASGTVDNVSMRRIVKNRQDRHALSIEEKKLLDPKAPTKFYSNRWAGFERPVFDSFAVDAAEELEGLERSDVYCFAMFREHHKDNWITPAYVAIEALILKRVKGAKNRFRRIGLAQDMGVAWFEGRKEEEIVVV